MNFPKDHQGLFEFAIDQRRKVIAEYSCSIVQDTWRLRHWAIGYASENGLKLPNDPETYGIYNEPDEEDLKELKAEGIYDASLTFQVEAY
jgi:hypothetical protein